MNIQLKKSDINKIGITIYPKNKNSGNTIFICDLKTANIEEIFLRNILNSMGYSILEVNDWNYDYDCNEIDSIQFVTNLPWEVYININSNE